MTHNESRSAFAFELKIRGAINIGRIPINIGKWIVEHFVSRKDILLASLRVRQRR